MRRARGQRLEVSRVLPRMDFYEFISGFKRDFELDFVDFHLLSSLS